MKSLEKDVPETISSVLSTHDWQGRKQLIEKVFKPDAKFWHLFFLTKGRRELFGVYQMWGAYNFWIGVNYTRVVPDRKHQRVVVDLIETINVWWTPFPYLGIPVHLNLHVVLGVEKHPQAEHEDDLIFTFQEDHIFWVESLLLLNPILTLGLGPLALKYLRPPAGSAYAAIGNWKYSKLEVANQYKKQKAGFTDIEESIRHAIATAYGGTPEDKWDCSQRMYSEDAEFWHPLFIVKGRHNIFGAHMFWASINRKTQAHIQRIVLSHKDDIVMLDLEQRFWPFFFPRGWKPFALWAHVILTLEDSKTGQSGKVITKQEDHILWVESLVMRNLGPISRWFNGKFRRMNGLFFCFLGNFIYSALVWITNFVQNCKEQYEVGQEQALFDLKHGSK